MPTGIHPPVPKAAKNPIDTQIFSQKYAAAQILINQNLIDLRHLKNSTDKIRLCHGWQVGFFRPINSIICCQKEPIPFKIPIIQPLMLYIHLPPGFVFRQILLQKKEGKTQNSRVINLAEAD